MRPEIKFCGMTREGDVRAAAGLGASFVGFILAGGPRNLSIDRARVLAAAVPARMRRVGVVPAGGVSGLPAGSVGREVGVDILQLHGDPEPEDVRRARADFPGPIWAVVRVAGQHVPPRTGALFGTADAVVLDAHSASGLGGTGNPLPWDEIGNAVERVRGAGRFVLAGGLRPENVGRAIVALRPDVVDVSSGVESEPGIKDVARMREFYDAVKGSRVGA